MRMARALRARHVPRRTPGADAMHGTKGARDMERVTAVRAALEASSFDGLVCALPSNVLMLSGYWPVVGTACAVFGPGGTVVVVAPTDEHVFARAGWADAIIALESDHLDALPTVAETLRAPMRAALERAGLRGCRVGVEGGGQFEPSSYVGTYRQGASLDSMLRDEGSIPIPADELLSRLRSRLSARERGMAATACRIAQQAFVAAASMLQPGLTESDAATLVRARLGTPESDELVRRADGFAFCMSGANAAEAYGSYARSTRKRLLEGNLVLVHCNSYGDGFWTDITRTFCLGEPDARQRAMYDAVLSARAAALAIIRPGARAADVDAAARELLRSRGFGAQFKHSTGHGVGFAAIDSRAQPRLHPSSPDVLRAGMVCNVEPAIYIDGYGGIRHCDVVAVTDDGCDVLTPFQLEMDDLVISVLSDAPDPMRTTPAPQAPVRTR